jgi:hypothetical protein
MRISLSRILEWEILHIECHLLFTHNKNTFVCHQHHTVSLAATTAGSSAAGVELPTDDCRQSAGITDENSFFYFFMAGDHFFGEIFFFT